MAKNIYSKPVLFTILAVGTVLVGTLVTTFIPMMTAQMHPKLAGLKPYTALQLAGRDVYQSEGCPFCHTQTVRPLKTEVERYGAYSKAGEFYYDRPFLWGTKRTGPDLAREGGKYPDAWQYAHFKDPRAFSPHSIMPSFGWLQDSKLDPAQVQTHMNVLGFPYTPADIQALADKTRLDALVAYVQTLGTAVTRKAAVTAAVTVKKVHIKNPLAGNHEAAERGERLFEQNCEACHGKKGVGYIGPSLKDKNVFLYVKGNVPDDDYFDIIHNGTREGGVEDGRKEKGGMPSFGETLKKDEIWSLVTYIRSLQGEKEE
ncbi:MAG: cbb3-type cytochrome c oxidase subunit II [Nitrospiraceae bacterium]|nr:cbb3-type cytochrome c oxidase subunit II [Nitrospiraceae bacterium]